MRHERKEFLHVKQYHIGVTVYIELVIFNNFALDLLLMCVTQIVRRRKIHKLRIFFAACIGSASAVFYAVASPVWQVIIRLLLAPLLALIFDKYGKGPLLQKLKEYVSTLGVFCLSTFFLGGMITGASYLIGVDVKSYVQLGITALCVAVLLILIRYCIMTRSKRSRKFCSVVLTLNGENIQVEGLCDSGNTLTDDLSGQPVIILSEKTERLMLQGKSDEKSNCKSDEKQQCITEGFVSIKTVNGESTMPIIKFDKVEVCGKQFQAYGALSKENFDGFDVILQNSMF